MFPISCSDWTSIVFSAVENSALNFFSSWIDLNKDDITIKDKSYDALVEK